MSEATTQAGGRLCRHHLNGVVAASLLVLAGGAALAIGVPPSHHDLESAVTSASAPGAERPLRVDRWGSRFCWLPMSGDCANSDLLYDSGAVPAEQYRRQWQAALDADGWTRRFDLANVVHPGRVSWERNSVAVTLLTRRDDPYGPLFEWGTGDLVVTVESVGTLF